METTIQQLKDEVSTLEAWLGLREEQVRLALTQQANLLRLLAVRPLPPEDLEVERRKEAAIREEQDSLRESRQVAAITCSWICSLRS
jgi:hypothetical protein